MTTTDFLARLRAAIRGSVLVTTAGALVGRLGHEVAELPKDFSREPAGHRPPAAGDAGQRELDTFVGLLAASRLCTLCSRPVRSIVTAWQTARVRDIAGVVGTEIAGLDLAQTLRLTGVALSAAVLTDGVIRQFDPQPASAIRVWLWSALLATAVVLITASPRLAVAWRRRWSNR